MSFFPIANKTKSEGANTPSLLLEHKCGKMPLNGQRHGSSVSWPLKSVLAGRSRTHQGAAPLLAECVELIAATKQTNFCFCAAPRLRPRPSEQREMEDVRRGARPTVKFVGRGEERREREKPQFLQECKDERKKGCWTLEDGLHAFFCPIPGFLTSKISDVRPTCWFSSLPHKQNVRRDPGRGRDTATVKAGVKGFCVVTRDSSSALQTSTRKNLAE